MKVFGLIAMLCAALALSACGGGDSSADAPKDSEKEPQTFQPFEPEIDPPKTLPKKLIVNVLEEGSGAPAEPGDELLVEYYAVNEKDEKEYGSRSEGFEFELGARDYWPGWERGLEGMKVGERREILMPPQLTRNLGYLFYIVELIKIEKPKPETEKESGSAEEPESEEESESAEEPET